jgi:hypothetical protein
MHELVCPDDGVHRAYVSAVGATDAKGLVDKGDRCHHIGSGGPGERHRIATEKTRQTLYRVFAPGRAQIYRCRVVHDCHGVRPASRISTLGTLRLWQQFVDLRNDVVLIRRQSPGCVTQADACDQRNAGNYYDCHPHEQFSLESVSKFIKAGLFRKIP